MAYTIKQYNTSLPFLKNSFTYFYENLPHLSLEIFTYYIKNLDELNRTSEVTQLLKTDFTSILDEANLQEKIFYYETLSVLYQKLNNQSLEFDCLKKLQFLYNTREKENSFEELQKHTEDILDFSELKYEGIENVSNY